MIVAKTIAAMMIVALGWSLTQPIGLFYKSLCLILIVGLGGFLFDTTVK